MRYPLRYPLSIVLARLGMTLSVSVNVFYDYEANVYVATSQDVPGLVLESDTLDMLQFEVKEAIYNLLNDKMPKKSKQFLTDMICIDHLASL
jgi:hypothetical protein